MKKGGDESAEAQDQDRADLCEEAAGIQADSRRRRHESAMSRGRLLLALLTATTGAY